MRSGDEHKRNCEIDRIVQGCVGVRRTTGQHPGGIVVLPHGEEIYSFTPVQHPANDMTTDIITTHFDYHSIDHNLLKLDILGHDDPTMIRMLEDLTGLDARRLFRWMTRRSCLCSGAQRPWESRRRTSAAAPWDALGIPEFGTDFAMQMLMDTKPQSFLGPGPDRRTVPRYRRVAGQCPDADPGRKGDDFHGHLYPRRYHDLSDPAGPGAVSMSFTIMESVRKGKGLKPEWEEEMKDHDVPDWYIWSCKKIKYMFPKAHAAAYVMMAWRIAYCKVILSAGLLRGLFQYPCLCISAMS